MRSFGSFRRPRPALPPNSVEPIPGARGPVTSRQAAEWVQAAAAAIGPHSLHLVQSGQSILADGRSHTWEFMVRFRDLGCTGLLSVQPSDPDGDGTLCWRTDAPGGIIQIPDAATHEPH